MKKLVILSLLSVALLSSCGNGAKNEAMKAQNDSLMVELSYLYEKQQQDFLEAMDASQNAPSLSQAIRIKKLAQQGEFDYDAVYNIMNEEKKSELDTVTIKNETLRKYFPRNYTPRQMESIIIKLLDQWQLKKQQAKQKKQEEAR